MPLVSALAASHAPNILLEPGREWEDFMDLHYSMAPQASANRPTFEQQKKLRQDAEAAFAVLREDLEQAKPDVLIVVANDQFVNFFLEQHSDFFCHHRRRSQRANSRAQLSLPNHKELGKAIIRAGMGDGIDFSYGEHIELQHTQNVPLYFLLREAKIPILPIYVNTWVDPAPSPRRCYQVGELIRAVAENFQNAWRSSPPAGLSHFPGSPRIGEIDEIFDHQLLEVMRQGNGRSLVDYSVQDLLQAGDTEFLNWMVADRRRRRRRRRRIPLTCRTLSPRVGDS